ncbi:hypothetical protein, partial [Halarchaeum acidiphilum]|uniref:hypothetical protein n=1 Tax=Halarchaeum acidiphilum TaxID=489138 RepID=UPI00131F33F4
RRARDWRADERHREGEREHDAARPVSFHSRSEAMLGEERDGETGRRRGRATVRKRELGR